MANPIERVREPARSPMREPRRRIAQSRPLDGPVFFYNATSRDIMTREVATVRKDATLLDALEIMRTRKVSGLPVVDAGGKVVGVLSERDVGRTAARLGEIDRVQGGLDLLLAYLLRQPEATMKKLHEILGGQRVDRVMSRKLHSVSPEATLETIVHEFESRRINRLPVIEEGRLVGIVSRNDVLTRGTFRYPPGVTDAPEFGPESTLRESRRTV